MTHSENCNCGDHQIWRQHSDYCNCHSCKAVTGVACDGYGIVSNPLAEPRLLLDDDDGALPEECELERHRAAYDEHPRDMLRIDPDLDCKVSMR
jgi:hypothetical protein